MSKRARHCVRLTSKITHLHIEGVLHSQADQDLLEFVRLRQREAWQRHFDLALDKHIRTSPVLKGLVGERLLQLRM